MHRIIDDNKCLHPGVYIKQLLVANNINQIELARRLGVSGKCVSKIMNYEIPLSKRLARSLDNIFGINYEVWLTINRRYYDSLDCIEYEKRNAAEKIYYEKIDKKLLEYMISSDSKNKIEKVSKQLKIGCLQVLNNKALVQDINPSLTDIEVINTNAWLLLATNCDNPVYIKNKDKTFKPLTKVPNDLIARLKEKGININIIPASKNVMLNSIAKWINKDSVIVGVSDKFLNSNTVLEDINLLLALLACKRLKACFTLDDDCLVYTDKEKSIYNLTLRNN